MKVIKQSLEGAEKRYMIKMRKMGTAHFMKPIAVKQYNMGELEVRGVKGVKVRKMPGKAEK